MALPAILRRASTSMVPLATQAVRNQRALSTLFSVQSRGPGLGLGLSLGQKLTRPSFAPIATFSTDVDENLLRVLEAEIERADDPKGEPITDRIPFEIRNNLGVRIIFLTRKYGDEVIEARVDKFTAPFEDEDNDDGDDDGGDEQYAEVPTVERIESVPTVGIGPFEVVEPPSVPMVVTVSKGNGQFLKFSITAFTDRIRIDSLSIKNPDISDDQLACERPKFEDLDENLRKALQKYLEARWFDSKVMSFLLDYMEDKKAKKYLLWLNNLKKFVEK